PELADAEGVTASQPLPEVQTKACNAGACRDEKRPGRDYGKPVGLQVVLFGGDQQAERHVWWLQSEPQEADGRLSEHHIRNLYQRDGSDQIQCVRPDVCAQNA